MTAVTHKQNTRVQLALQHVPFWTQLTHIMALHRQRRDLLCLEDHLLQDIGITRQEARKEATRPLWDVPSHWRG